MKRILMMVIAMMFLVACGGTSNEPDPLPPDNGGAESQLDNNSNPSPTQLPDPTDAPEESMDSDGDMADAASNDTDSTDSDEEVANNSTGDLGSDYLGSYAIEDTGFGTQVNVVVDSDAKTRTIVSNALPNHETGEFPNPGNPNAISEQSKTWTYPTEATFTGTPTFVREPGVAISGVKFEPDTAERVNCESGEEYRIEAIQEFTDLGLDFNNAHVQPTGEYHYHGASNLLVEAFDSGQDLVHIAFAADGHLMVYSKSGAYQPSYQLGTGERAGTNCTYTLPGPSGGETIDVPSEIDGTVNSDWAYDESYGDLDECNGIMVDGQYIYLITNDYPYIPRCLMGESDGAGAPGSGGAQGSGPGAGGQGDRPDFAAAAATLGITEQALMDAIGGPPPNFEAAAETLGMSAEDIEAAVESSRGAEGGAPPAAGNAPEGEMGAMVGDGIDDVGDGRLFELPGDNIYPEGVSYNPANGKFYVGATSDGTLYEGDVNGAAEMTVFSEGGADGRTAAIGTKVDSDGNLWVAGGGTGQVWVYDTATGDLIANFTTPAAEATFINDLAITADGVYFTDSLRPILWKASGLDGGEAEAWVDFTGSVLTYGEGFNLNGIVATADESALIVVHLAEGELYAIDIATKEVTWLETGDTPLTAGDGLALVDNTLYVTRNNFGEIVPITLADDLSSGVGGDVITSDLFGYPTTIAYTGNTFLVANSQFNNRTAGTPDLPFTVAQIPVPAMIVEETGETVAPVSGAGTDSDRAVDTTLFLDGALAEDAVIEACTLSDGTETMCYTITIAGYPANHDVGPFCPETTETSAADAGIWFDGNGIYDVDGAFILGLAELYDDTDWKLYNDDGSVNITDTQEEFEAAARPDVDPDLYNHCVAGQMEWLDNGEPVQTTVTIPVNPVAAESSSRGGNWGVTLNGVIIAASAPVDAILSAYTIAVFDDCGGHINPNDGYHMHGARGCGEVGEAADGETPIFAYAMDGYPVHSALSDEDLAAADLDECNGHETDELGYHYHANPAEENSVLTCFKGLTVGGNDGGRGGRGGGG